MTDSRSHRGRGRRIVVLAALGLLAGTAWLLPARSGSPSPAVHARAGRQTGHMPATPTHLAHHASATPHSTRRHVAQAASPQPGSPVPGVPVRLRIPALGLRTAIEPVGLRAGAMGVPTNVWHVGWFHLGPRPGDVGNAVIDGHLDSTTGPAIFRALHNLRVGDRIYVTDRAGSERGFVVTALHSYRLTDAPRARIFGPTTGRHLNLITCSGTWQAWAHLYDQRLVVYTRLLG
jgi:sortase (surface protein transpeptidase)